MANGDAAAAAGLPVVPATKDIRLGYDDINRLADAVAQHLTAGGHDFSKITGKPDAYPSSWGSTSGRPVSGYKAAPTDANGFYTFTHALGRLPVGVEITMCGPPFAEIDELVARLADAIVVGKTETTVTLRVRRLDTGAWFPLQGIAFLYTVS